MGYLFLVNVIVILMQSRAVIEIFYDVLALQFVQQLDDIAFRMAKMDVFGKRMLHAAISQYFHTQLKKQKESNLFLSPQHSVASAKQMYQIVSLDNVATSQKIVTRSHCEDRLACAISLGSDRAAEKWKERLGG